MRQISCKGNLLTTLSRPLVPVLAHPLKDPPPPPSKSPFFLKIRENHAEIEGSKALRAQK